MEVNELRVRSPFLFLLSPVFTHCAILGRRSPAVSMGSGAAGEPEPVPRELTLYSRANPPPLLYPCAVVYRKMCVDENGF